MIAAIDPGKNGAIAFLSADGNGANVYDLPYIGTEIDTDALAVLFSYHPTTQFCVIETPVLMPGRSGGASTSFYNYGRIIERLHVLGVSVTRITPRQWTPKNKIKLSSKDIKKERVRMARERFPHIDILISKDGQADALLMADWARLNR